MLSAHDKGEAAYKLCEDGRLKTGVGFYDTIKRQQLKTFSDLTRYTKTSKVSKEVCLKSDHRLFGKMVLIAQSRKLNMREIFCYPLGPLPWSLANADGTMKKTNKAVLGQYLEQNESLCDHQPSKCAVIIDAMAIIQKVRGEITHLVNFLISS